MRDHPLFDSRPPIYSLARKPVHAIKRVMNKVIKIRTPGSGFAMITDRSCITP